MKHSDAWLQTFNAALAGWSPADESAAIARATRIADAVHPDRYRADLIGTTWVHENGVAGTVTDCDHDGNLTMESTGAVPWCAKGALWQTRASALDEGALGGVYKRVEAK